MKQSIRSRIFEVMRRNPGLASGADWHAYLQNNYSWYKKERKNFQATLRTLEIRGALPPGIIIARLGKGLALYGYIKSANSLPRLKLKLQAVMEPHL